MPVHKLKVIRETGARPLFTGPIPAGIGDHDYLCGRCGEPVLKRVDERDTSPAVFQCTKCESLNVVKSQGRSA
jgi:DNA-directed RNA polymerase subunit RPC12/RpoP